MSFRQAIYLVIGIVGFSVWSFMAWIDPTIRGAYLTFVTSSVVTVIGVALRESPTIQPPEQELPK
jgi:hypothetical protein